MTDLNVVEICAGAGGQSLGLHLAGFQHSLAVEIDHTAARTLRRNLKRLGVPGDENKLVQVGDVADEEVWKPEDYTGKVHLLAGGVPCPPFSVAGKQLGSADERDLFAWAVEAAGRIQPEALMLENVRGLNDTRFAGYRQAVVDRLGVLGYRAFWKLLEAKDYGVPQLRPRMVLVALKDEYVPFFRWPDEEKHRTDATVGTALQDLMGERGFKYLDKWVKAANDIAPTIVGGSKKHGGADLGPTRAKKAWAELWTDGHGLDNHAPDKNWKLKEHPRGPKLTVDMVKRLQGWLNEPDYYWEFEGLKTSQYRQVGNAFPPPVARRVGESVAAALQKKVKAPEGHEHLLVTTHDEVYRALRAAPGFLSEDRLQRLLGAAVTADDLARRIDFISRDFQVETKVRGGVLSYRLGEWKAFVGQDDHRRHLAFAEHSTRSRVS